MLSSSSSDFTTLRIGAAGAVFGAALTASEVYLPSVIVGQMRLEDFHMLGAFLSASAVSATVIALFDRLNLVRRPTRKGSRSLGWWGAPYDANVLGGLLVGAGMTLTGACPGTVIVQIATSGGGTIRLGMVTALGGVLGGVLYAGFTRIDLLRISTAPTLDDDVDENNKAAETIYSTFDLNPNHVLLAYEIPCGTVIVGISVLDLEHSTAATTRFLPPFVGGMLIGGAQAASLLLTGQPIGVSTAYEDVGRRFWDLCSFFGASGKARGSNTWMTRSMKFALGIGVGSFALSRSSPGIIAAQVDDVDIDINISGIRAFLGGCIMVFGSRVAGGCTSGHGISGMSNFAISSIITVIAMFAGGILTAKALS